MLSRKKKGLDSLGKESWRGRSTIDTEPYGWELFMNGICCLITNKVELELLYH